jgi:hypothetical protein
LPSLCVVCLGPVASRARVLVHKVLGRDAQGALRGGARCASKVYYEAIALATMIKLKY